jgi:hypothetical protein
MGIVNNKIPLPGDSKEVALNKIRNYLEHINEARKEVSKTQSLSDLSEKYWRKVRTFYNLVTYTEH